jgi:hypothetical protein
MTDVTRRGGKKAIVALAQRLAVILHRIWIDSSEFHCASRSIQQPPKKGGSLSSALAQEHPSRRRRTRRVRREPGSALAGRCSDVRLHPSDPIMWRPFAPISERRESPARRHRFIAGSGTSVMKELDTISPR